MVLDAACAALDDDEEEEEAAAAAVLLSVSRWSDMETRAASADVGVK